METLDTKQTAHYGKLIIEENLDNESFLRRLLAHNNGRNTWVIQVRMQEDNLGKHHDYRRGDDQH